MKLLRTTNKAVELGESDVEKSQRNPKNISKLVRALHNQATIHEKLGGDNLEQALDCFNKALSYDPKYSPSYNGRARLS